MHLESYIEGFAVESCGNVCLKTHFIVVKPFFLFSLLTYSVGDLWK